MFDTPRTPKSISRRALLAGDVSQQSEHIASLLVQMWPDKAETIAHLLDRIPGIETHGISNGKLIVTVEAASDAQLVELIGAVEAADGVVAASLAYHQIEDFDNV